jgi:hypothetical protein
MSLVEATIAGSISTYFVHWTDTSRRAGRRVAIEDGEAVYSTPGFVPTQSFADSTIVIADIGVVREPNNPQSLSMRMPFDNRVCSISVRSSVGLHRTGSTRSKNFRRAPDSLAQNVCRLVCCLWCSLVRCPCSRGRNPIANTSRNGHCACKLCGSTL